MHALRESNKVWLNMGGLRQRFPSIELPSLLELFLSLADLGVQILLRRANARYCVSFP
jgi:hypothetical protein